MLDDDEQFVIEPPDDEQFIIEPSDDLAETAADGSDAD
jgi:hypothetical protein